MVDLLDDAPACETVQSDASRARVFLAVSLLALSQLTKPCPTCLNSHIPQRNHSVIILPGILTIDENADEGAIFATEQVAQDTSAPAIRRKLKFYTLRCTRPMLPRA